MFVESLETRKLMSASLDPVTKILTINGSAGDDVITVAKVGDKLKVTENGSSKLFTASKVGKIRAFGNAGIDRITVDASVTTSAELHAGLGGNTFGLVGERLQGGSGNDTLFADGQAAHVDLFGGAGNDTLYATKSESRAEGEAGNDTIFVRATYVQATGGSGKDKFVVQGRLAGSSFDGGTGEDTVDFSSQTERLLLGNASALDARGFGLYSGVEGEVSGPDTGVLIGNNVEVIRGGRNHDRILGGSINNVLYGGLGDDTLVGGAGSDALFGEDGNDVLDGRDGEPDFLSGGFGSDLGYKDSRDTTIGVEKFGK